MTDNAEGFWLPAEDGSAAPLFGYYNVPDASGGPRAGHRVTQPWIERREGCPTTIDLDIAEHQRPLDEVFGWSRASAHWAGSEALERQDLDLEIDLSPLGGHERSVTLTANAIEFVLTRSGFFVVGSQPHIGLAGLIATSFTLEGCHRHAGSDARLKEIYELLSPDLRGLYVMNWHQRRAEYGQETRMQEGRGRG